VRRKFLPCSFIFYMDDIVLKFEVIITIVNCTTELIDRMHACNHVSPKCRDICGVGTTAFALLGATIVLGVKTDYTPLVICMGLLSIAFGVFVVLIATSPDDNSAHEDNAKREHQKL
jgi:hypothetical protein